jgi:LuxR family maltose regulon positive regulatory protein
MRAHIAIERGAFAEALTLARQALALLPETDHLARSSNALVLGYALMVLGHTAEAIVVHVENVQRARTVGNAVSALFSATEVVKMRVLQGRLGAARASVEQALAWAVSEGWQQLPPTSALYIWSGNVLLEQGDFSAAEAQLVRAIRLTQHGPAITAARAHVFLARLRQIQGDRDGANEALTTVEGLCRSWERGGERSFFAAYTARVRLLQGDFAAARQWGSEQTSWNLNETPSYFREIELLTIARIAILDRTGPVDEARLTEMLSLIRWLYEHANAAGHGAVVIETLALESLALARLGQVIQAHERLDQALTQAAPERFFGIFLDFGSPMAELLRQNFDRRAANDPLRPYLAQILRMFALDHSGRAERAEKADVAQPAIGTVPLRAEALTERELEVLRLFAAGMTSPDIAQHFVVSINTVKTQIKSIYSKLDSHSRAEMIARARELGLIP